MSAPGPDIRGWQIRAALAATPVSRTWQVARGDELAVLRRDEPGARRLGLNRAAEPAVLRAAAAAGLGPECLAADPATGVLLTQWLPGQTWTGADLGEPHNLARAAALLRRVHATPLAGPVVDLGAAIDRYAAAAGSGAAALAAKARGELAAALGAASAATNPGDAPVAPEGAPTGAPTSLCFCHNDPTPGNFIDSPVGDLRLIDWEYAGLGDPGFDLAGLAVGAELTAGQVVKLLTAYRGRPPTAEEMARQRAWENFSESLGALWLAALHEPVEGTTSTKNEPDPGPRL